MAVIYWELTTSGNFAMVSEEAYESGLAALDPETVMEYPRVPWDLLFLQDWIHEILLEGENAYDFVEKYFNVGGASPGGNIDGYAPKDLKVLLGELTLRGHELVKMGIFDGYGDVISEMMNSNED
jgi:hypothetical protein